MLTSHRPLFKKINKTATITKLGDYYFVPSLGYQSLIDVKVVVLLTLVYVTLVTISNEEEKKYCIILFINQFRVYHRFFLVCLSSSVKLPNLQFFIYNNLPYFSVIFGQQPKSCQLRMIIQYLINFLIPLVLLLL